MEPNVNYRKYFLSTTDSDFAVEADGGERFPVHRIVLEKSGVEFFEKLFSDDNRASLEIRRGIVKFSFDPEVVKVFLEYIYTGASETIKAPAKNIEVLRELLKMADMYGVVNLKNLCVQLIKLSLKADNVENHAYAHAVEIYKLGNIFNLPDLKAAAKDCFTRNKKKIVPNLQKMAEFLIDQPDPIIYELLFE